MRDCEIKQKELCNQFAETDKCWNIALLWRKSVNVMRCCISWIADYFNQYFQNLQGTKVKTLNNSVKIKALQYHV